MRALIEDALTGFDERFRRERSPTLSDLAKIDLLKVSLSDHATRIVLDCLTLGGLDSYRQNHAASIERQVRDVLSAPIMLGNDQLYDGAASSMSVGPPMHSLIEFDS
jgi:acyl-CoA dehydrogenase